MTDQPAAEQLLADYRRSREQLAAVHRALARLAVSESSPDGAITVTVGARGTLTDLSVHEETYRHYRPSRLADTILRLTAVAAERATAEAARILAPVLPPGADPVAFVSGTADLRPDELDPEPPPSPFDTDDHLSRTWMEDMHQGHHHGRRR
ncbi:MAG TPA: YbaB/EbfC family nucleoid-associated protein [Pseudonocardiaceae bacterium]